MKIGIIVEGNEVIGLGHIIRCKNIAKYLNSRLTDVTLILPESFDKTLIEDFDNILVPNDKWFNIKNNHEYYKNLLKDFDSVLLDLIEQKYSEFSFLEELPLFITSLTLFEFKYENYFGNVALFPTISKSIRSNGNTVINSGPQFFIIDDKIKNAKRILSTNNSIPTILISMGGADPANITEKVIKSTDYLNFDYKAIVIAGMVNKNKGHIKSLVARRSNFKFYEFVNNIENVYAQIDFAIINGGNTRYELTYLQIPYACISIHKTQNNINKNVTNLFGGLNLGIYNEITENYIAIKIQKAISSPETLNNIKQKMKNFKGGNGQIIIGDTLINKRYIHEEND
jgi:UDP-2,4-diacetamido-2,4,6-trideoxy-beta-L-altropyranose hydrolase